MLVGAHVSVAGGLHLAFARGRDLSCECIQIFTGFNTRWAAREIDDLEASCFRSEAAANACCVLSHACYLINLASPDQTLWQRSIEALIEELERCELIGVPYVVLHPGSHMGRGEAQGLKRVSRALGEVHHRTSGFQTKILLENTAGQGNTLGDRVAQLGYLLSHTADSDRLGVCIDTCHAFAAGYELRTESGYQQWVAELEYEVGLDRVIAFHLNDSKGEYAKRIDRHAPIGEGEIGQRAFARLVNDSRFADRPAVLELADAFVPPSLRRLKRLRKNVPPV